MSQFTNQYNSQNGMMATQQQGNTGQQMGMMYPQSTGGTANWMNQNQQSMGPPSQPMEPQGWKMYVPNNANNKPLIGRWVGDFEEIKPRDVPMDGSFAIFPQTDQYGNLSCIYAMIWGSDGMIKPYRFLPEMIVVEKPSDQGVNPDPVKDILANFTSTMNDRLDSLERRIGDILTPFTVSQVPVNSVKPKRNTVKESDPT